MEEEERGNGWLWAGLIISLLAAIAFAVLWHMRGGEIERLRAGDEAARQSAAATEARLDGEISSLQTENAAKDRRITEIENSLREDVRQAQEAGRAAERRLRTELDAARSSIAEADEETARQVGEATATARAEAENLRANLRAAEDALSELTGEQTRIREEYESASSVLEATRRQTATSERELTDLRDLAATLEKQAADNAAALAAVERERAGAERGRADAERELARTREELERARAGTAESSAPEDADAGAADEAAIAASVAAEIEAGRQREQNLNSKVQELTERMAEREADFVARMAAARDAALARVEALEKEYAARLAAAEGKLAEAEAKLTAATPMAATPAPAATRAAAAEGKPAAATSFAEGRIFGRMPDGSTFLVSGGAEQRVRPGMKFDVYRPEGGASRYIGAVRVIRVLDGYSLAVSTGGGETVRLCPATGRVVMDSAVTESPFAPGRELLNVTADDYVFDAPAVGDRLDNPFFTTSRPLRFGLDGDLAGDECVLGAIEGLGGMPLPGNAAERDYLLVRADGDGTKRISLEHLAAYLDPRPDFSCE